MQNEYLEMCMWFNVTLKSKYSSLFEDNKQASIQPYSLILPLQDWVTASGKWQTGLEDMKKKADDSDACTYVFA